MDILPRICRGEVCFAIGMSEPNSGSDLFAAKTKATKTDGGWLINGTKIWTSQRAHRRLHDRAVPHLAADQGKPPPRPDAVPGRHEDAGHHGEPDLPDRPASTTSTRSCSPTPSCRTTTCSARSTARWKQATSELAYERSGPERFLETFYVLTELVRALGEKPDTRARRRARPPRGAAAHAAAHVGVGGRHAAGRQGAGGGSLDRQGHRHDVGAEAAASRARACRLRRGERRATARRWKSSSRFATMIAPEAHHPGRHHRSAARHHRARAGSALTLDLSHSTRKHHDQLHRHRRRDAAATSARSRSASRR